MSEGHFRLSIIHVLTAVAAVSFGADCAQAQFFPGFGAPQQQINTARGAIQLAPGWRVATTPVRTGQGYRVAVRSDFGEERSMFIGANGSLAVEPRAGAMRAPSRPLTKIERAPRQGEARPRTKVAVIRAPAKPSSAAASPLRDAKPASADAAIQNIKTPPPTNDAAQKWQAPDPVGPQAPGFAHGVPINPLD